MPQPHPTIGHVHLRVANLDRAVAFYRDLLGFEETQRFGDNAVFLGAGGYHHHVALNVWDSKGGTPPPKGHTGLYHTAFLYPDRKSLGAVTKRVQDAGHKLTGTADHGVSEAVYLDDPDGNGVELYRDRPRAEWPRDATGNLAMVNASLDVAALVAEAELAAGGHGQSARAAPVSPHLQGRRVSWQRDFSGTSGASGTPAAPMPSPCR